MSTKAHIVLEFGKNRIELYRHWGGDLEITGFDLIQKIMDAPAYKERAHFHDGGYVLRLILGDSGGDLPQYEIVDGLAGHDWSHGYHLKFNENDEIPESTTVQLGGEEVTFTNTPEVQVVGSCTGQWRIRYAELEGWESLEEWMPEAKEYSLEEFGRLVSEATDEAVKTGKISDYDARDEFLSRFKKEND